MPEFDDDLAGEGEVTGARLERAPAPGPSRRAERARPPKWRNGKRNGSSGRLQSCGAYGRTEPNSTRPFSVASTAPVARPRNKPCSTTPGMASSAAASASGRSILPQMGVEDEVAAVGDDAVCRRAAALNRTAPDMPPFRRTASTARRVASRPNGTTSIGSGKRPERVDALRAVGDHDHAPARGGDDLLAQERPAAALDEPQVVVESRPLRRR